MKRDIEDVEVAGLRSTSGYVRASLKSWQALIWVWRELTSPKGRWYMRRMVLWAVLRNGVRLLIPYFVSTAAIFAEQGLFSQARQEAWYLLGAIVVSYLIRLMQDWQLEYGLTEMMIHLDLALNVRFYDKSLGQHRDKAGLLEASNVEKARGRVWETVGMLLWNGTEGATQILMSVMFLWALFPGAGWVMTLTVLLFFGSSIFLNRKVLEVGELLDRDERAINRRRADLWEHAALVIWADAVEREVNDLFSRASDMVARLRRLWIPYVSLANARSVVVGAVIVLVFSWALELIEHGELEVAVLVPLGIWCVQLASSMDQIRGLDRMINWNTPAIRAMRDTLEEPCDVVDALGAVALPSGPLGIEVEDLVYQYKPGHAVLKRVSFSVSPGERVALVGLSGSGKTTTMRLLRREMRPLSGAVRVADMDLENVQLSSWRSAVGYIPQTSDLVNDTLRRNLLFYVPMDRRSQYTDEELWQLLDSVCLADRTRFEEGLETKIGKRGVELSGGEQQRLLIARALVMRPRVLLVDEATSSLDAEIEERVQAAIDHALGMEMTAVVIAHRLATIANVDRVIVLQGGRIIDQGTHVELFERCDLFRRLCTKQKISYARAS